MCVGLRLRQCVGRHYVNSFFAGPKVRQGIGRYDVTCIRQNPTECRIQNVTSSGSESGRVSVDATSILFAPGSESDNQRISFQLTYQVTRHQPALEPVSSSKKLPCGRLGANFRKETVSYETACPHSGADSQSTYAFRASGAPPSGTAALSTGVIPRVTTGNLHRPFGRRSRQHQHH